MKVVTGIIIGMLMALNAQAAFIKQDWSNTGDQLVSVDTNANLAWLSPSLFFGMSWNEVEDRLTNDPLYQGYRFASVSEYVSLLGPGSLDLLDYPEQIPSEGSSRFIDHFSLGSATSLGFLEFYFGTPYFEPFFGPEGDYIVDFSGVHFDENGNMFIADLANPAQWLPNYSSNDHSYLLVRDVSEVPEPAPYLLMLLGLFAVAAGKVGSARRQSNIAA
jgi:hypothetical protein